MNGTTEYRKPGDKGCVPLPASLAVRTLSRRPLLSESVVAPRRKALTLIELLVVIILLVTLVAGVLPLLSPNNDANKIQSASSNLQTYLQKAQAKAIRTGRPVGVMFRESDYGSGVALEAFQVEVPQPFTGFSSSATARFRPNYNRNQDGAISPAGDYTVEFGEGFGNSFVSGFDSGIDYIPPGMVKVGDLLEVGSSVFRLDKPNDRVVDQELKKETGEEYFKPTSQFTKAILVAGPSPPTAPITANGMTFPDSFAVARQPAINSEPSLTLPRGVAIDMSASGTEGGTLTTLFAGGTADDVTLKQISIMFSPTGGIENVQYNAYPVKPSGGNLIEQRDQAHYFELQRRTPIANVSQVMLLLATVEKSGLGIADNSKNDNSERPWNLASGASKDQVEQAREKVSWLNPDSRWVAIKGRSSSIKVAENSLVNPRKPDGAQRAAGYGALDQIIRSRGENTPLDSVDKVATAP